MILTNSEQLMYSVMKAIYDSGIPIDFKGAMVMKACLLEYGYTESVRQTVDIDGNWHSESAPSEEQIVSSINNALLAQNIILNIEFYRMYGNGRSAGLKFRDPANHAVLLSMDLDVNRPVQPTRIYEISGIRFKGIAPTQMLADKISAVSSQKIFRRIKDVIDLYYLSHVIELDTDLVLKTIANGGRHLEDFDGFLNRIPELEHAYDRFRLGGVNEKPSFDEVYTTVKNYLKDILPE